LPNAIRFGSGATGYPPQRTDETILTKNDIPMNKQQFEKLHSAIQAHLDSFTPTERRIASYLMEQSKEIALVSVQELAVRLHTGPASIIRFVKKLGYDGLAALKAELREDIRTGGSPLAQFKNTLDHGLEPGLKEVRLIAGQEITNIQNSLSVLSEATFAKTVQMIIKADHIYTVGVGTSAHIAAVTSFLLRRIGLRADTVTHTGLRLTESLIGIGKKDLLIAFSFPPYSESTLDAAAFAKQQKASVIGFTNEMLAPIADHCDALLIAKTDSRIPANAISAPLLLVSGLISVAAAKTRKRSSQALETTIRLRKQRTKSASSSTD
jgi:DNA-binding MurR/RpiR family transcriptional regulator